MSCVSLTRPDYGYGWGRSGSYARLGRLGVESMKKCRRYHCDRAPEPYWAINLSCWRLGAPSYSRRLDIGLVPRRAWRPRQFGGGGGGQLQRGQSCSAVETPNGQWDCRRLTADVPPDPTAAGIYLSVNELSSADEPPNLPTAAGVEHAPSSSDPVRRRQRSQLAGWLRETAADVQGIQAHGSKGLRDTVGKIAQCEAALNELRARCSEFGDGRAPLAAYSVQSGHLPANEMDTQWIEDLVRELQQRCKAKVKQLKMALRKLLKSELTNFLKWIDSVQHIVDSSFNLSEGESPLVVYDDFMGFARQTEERGADKLLELRDAAAAVLQRNIMPTSCLSLDDTSSTSLEHDLCTIDDNWHELVECMDTKSQYLAANRNLHWVKGECERCLQSIEDTTTLLKSHHKSTVVENGTNELCKPARVKKEARVIQTQKRVEVNALISELRVLHHSYAGEENDGLIQLEERLATALASLCTSDNSHKDSVDPNTSNTVCEPVHAVHLPSVASMETVKGRDVPDSSPKGKHAQPVMPSEQVYRSRNEDKDVHSPNRPQRVVQTKRRLKKSHSKTLVDKLLLLKKDVINYVCICGCCKCGKCV